MGQTNSCQCSSHYLATGHSNEGYCSLCRERFSNVQSRDIPDGYGSLADDLKKKSFSDYKCKLEKQRRRRAKLFENSRPAFGRECWELEPDLIYKCDLCPRFFYSVGQLVEHMASPGRDHTRTSCLNRRASQDTSNGLRASRTLERMDSTLLHLQRREISNKDCETERQHVCCVRCGIYFTSKEQRRKHFRDVDKCIMRVEAEIDSIWDDANKDDGYDSDDSDEYPSAALFPMPPSTLPIPAQIQITSISQPRVPVIAYLSNSISLDTSYVPELRTPAEDMRHPLLVARLGPPYAHSDSSLSSGFSVYANEKGPTHDF